MLTQFGLTLVVNHACNLRCTYCYTGDKVRRPMPRDVGFRAIDRALASLAPGGLLNLAFFGGEPLLEAPLILEFVEYAKAAAARGQVTLALYMTTNATFDSGAAWEVMTLPDMQLTISHDGLPEVHDRNRVALDGRGSSERVLETMSRLQDAGIDFGVVLVVGPDSVVSLPDGLEFLRERGVSRFNPSLNLWTEWRRSDGHPLQAAIAGAADFWAEHLPEVGISWFDERAAWLLKAPVTETSRCGFGEGEIAVTPRGNLYPCERLVGADVPANPMRLPGTIMEGDDFLMFSREMRHSLAECAPCILKASCSTATCRCSNFVRTGDVNRPDGLLCLFDQACYQETARVLKQRAAVPAGVNYG